MNHYHNTLWAEGAVLAGYESKAETQDEAVLELLKHNPEYFFTAEQVHKSVMGAAPLTSARRALSNLYRGGCIEKSNNHAQGKYGRPVTLWRIKCSK